MGTGWTPVVGNGGTVSVWKDEALVSAMDRNHRGQVRVTGSAGGDRWQKDGELKKWYRGRKKASVARVECE